MNSWSHVKIKDIAKTGRENFIDGDWVEAPHIKDEGIRLIQTGNIGVGKFIDRSKKYISEDSFRELNCKEVRPNDVLICRLAEPVGRSCVVPEGLGKSITSVDVVIFRINEEKYNKEFVVQAINTQEFLDRCLEVSAGSTRTRISRTNLGQLEISCPDIQSQGKIAKILTTIDQLIEKTQALIDKHIAIKQGMMADLFTRGIDPTTRQLRPPVDQAPHLYKETELGWIPKEWSIQRLSDFFAIKHGYAFEGEYFSDKPPGEILLTPGNFHRTGGLYFTSDNTKYFTSRYSDGYLLKKGDYLVVMTDLSPQTLILGRFVYLDSDIRLLHNQRIGKLINKNKSKWSDSFLIGMLNQEYVRNNIILSATGTTVRHTSPDRVLNNFVGRPDITEQKIIGEILDSNNLIIKKYIDEKIKVDEIKHGLMQDLLTGKVSVQ